MSSASLRSLPRSFSNNSRSGRGRRRPFLGSVETIPRTFSRTLVGICPVRRTKRPCFTPSPGSVCDFPSAPRGSATNHTTATIAASEIKRKTAYFFFMAIPSNYSLQLPQTAILTAQVPSPATKTVPYPEPPIITPVKVPLTFLIAPFARTVENVIEPLN